MKPIFPGPQPGPPLPDRPTQEPITTDILLQVVGLKEVEIFMLKIR